MTWPATYPEPPQRVRTSYVNWLGQRLSARDWQVIETVNLLRVATGHQLERTCFAEMAPGRSRTVTRSRVLARLVRDRVLAPVGRRVGGSGRGSSVQVYALDTAGQQLVAHRQLAAGVRVRVRRPGSPGVRSLAHSLAVSDLYADLTEALREGGGRLASFAAEPAAWWSNGTGGYLKPDAYAELERPGVRDHWWVEADRATESLPTLHAKIQTYLDFARRSELGPDKTMPWVLVSTVTVRRRDAITAMVRRLPGADELVSVVLSTDAALHLIEVLKK